MLLCMGNIQGVLLLATIIISFRVRNVPSQYAYITTQWLATRAFTLLARTMFTYVYRSCPLYQCDYILQGAVTNPIYVIFADSMRVVR